MLADGRQVFLGTLPPVLVTRSQYVPRIQPFDADTGSFEISGTEFGRHQLAQCHDPDPDAHTNLAHQPGARHQLIQLVQLGINQCRTINPEIAGELVMPCANRGESVTRITADGSLQQGLQCIGYALQCRMHEYRFETVGQPPPNEPGNDRPVLGAGHAGAAELHDHPG